MNNSNKEEPLNTYPRRRFTLGNCRFDGSESFTSLCCSCNVEKLEQDLTKLQISSKGAIQKTWDEVETLRQSNIAYDNQIGSLKKKVQKGHWQLSKSLSHIEYLELRLEKMMESQAFGQDITIHDSRKSFANKPTYQNTLDNVRRCKSRNDLNASTDGFSEIAVPHASSSSFDKEAKVRALKLALISRNSTITAMEEALLNNVKMMQSFETKIMRYQEMTGRRVSLTRQSK